MLLFKNQHNLNIFFRVLVKVVAYNITQLTLYTAYIPGIYIYRMEHVWIRLQIGRHFVGIYTHTIHGTGIFNYIWLICMVNVGKYTGFYGIC